MLIQASFLRYKITLGYVPVAVDVVSFDKLITTPLLKRSSGHDTLIQCRFNVGPASITMDLRKASTGQRLVFAG